MIELDERDIKAIAQARFNTRYLKAIIAFFVTWVALTALMFSNLRDNTPMWLEIATGVVLVGLYLAGVLLWQRLAAKAERALVKEWREAKAAQGKLEVK